MIIHSIRPDSDILHVKLFQTHVVVLNSARAAKELLEKRSALFSDRHVDVNTQGNQNTSSRTLM
jgi:hypothetical protein